MAPKTRQTVDENFSQNLEFDRKTNMILKSVSSKTAVDPASFFVNLRHFFQYRSCAKH